MKQDIKRITVSLLLDRVMSYITEAETSITSGNTTDASDKLGLAVARVI